MGKRSHSKARKEPDYSQILQEHQAFPDTAAELAESEHARSEKMPKLAPNFVELNNTNNTWSNGGLNNQMKNSNRGLRSQKQGTGGPTINPGWKHEGSLLNVPHSSSDQRSQDASGRARPQPGDAEWEKVESAWEQKLEERGFKAVMEEIRKQSPEKYRELHFRTRPESAQLAFGDDKSARQHNDVLETGIPTVAFMLTQQQFGQRVSSLNGEERLTRKHDSKSVGITEAYGNVPVEELEAVHHEKENEEFLDLYGERNHGDTRLRKQEAIPEKHVYCEMPQRTPHTEGFVEGTRKEAQLDSEVHDGPNSPLVFPRVLTQSQVRDLQIRLISRENELLRCEEFCRVCGETFKYGSSEAQRHYQQHKLMQLCPVCQEDWSELTRRNQIFHLVSSHLIPLTQQEQGDCPSEGCSENLANVARFPSYAHILKHLQTHANPERYAPPAAQKSQAPNICSFPSCHTDLNSLSSRHRKYHQGIHSPHPSGKAKVSAPTKLYCDKCMQCMQSAYAKTRHNHATLCQTVVKAFLEITPAEASVRRAANKVAKVEEAKKTTPTFTRSLRTRDYETPIVEEDLVTETTMMTSTDELETPEAGTKRKRHSTAKATPTPAKRARKK